MTLADAPSAAPRTHPPETVREVVRAVDLHKIYDTGGTRVNALRGISFIVRAGEFVSIMGASGSGKSTLLNILGCLDVPTSGEFQIQGQHTAALDNEQLAELRNRDIGFIFQNFNLLHRSTALENVELPMVYRGVPASQRIRRAMDALTRVGLADRTEHMPFQLSGGQQQRVAIARSLVNEPQILLADEPTGNLDTRTSAEIMSIVTALHEKDGKTVILVTHDPGVASFAGRVVVLKDGEIIVDQPTPRCGGPKLPDVHALSIAP